MAVKYQCPKCGRRFTEWGAEKLGFKCPQDEFCPKDATDDIELVPAGQGEEKTPKRVSLKRTIRRRPTPRKPVAEEDEALVPDVDEFGEDDSDAVDENDDSIEADDSDDAEAGTGDGSDFEGTDDDSDEDSDDDDEEADTDGYAEEEDTTQ